MTLTFDLMTCNVLVRHRLLCDKILKKNEKSGRICLKHFSGLRVGWTNLPQIFRKHKLVFVSSYAGLKFQKCCSLSK